MGGWVEAEAGRPGGEEIQMLGPPDGSSMHRLGVDEARLAEPLEVQSHGVGVDAEAIGELGGRQRGRRQRPLPIHGVAGLIGERLEDPEIQHRLDRTLDWAYFQARLVLLTDDPF
jgi:hypothetical protein